MENHEIIGLAVIGSVLSGMLVAGLLARLFDQRANSAEKQTEYYRQKVNEYARRLRFLEVRNRATEKKVAEMHTRYKELKKLEKKEERDRQHRLDAEA